MDWYGRIGRAALPSSVKGVTLAALAAVSIAFLRSGSPASAAAGSNAVSIDRRSSHRR